MEAKKALSKLMLLCSRKEYCISEITNKLKKWGVDEVDIKNIISTLKKEKFIDETRYTEFFVHDKIWLNKWGKRKAAYQLKFKGIPELLITHSLKKINTNKYEKMIYEEMTKKFNTIKEANLLKIKSKLLNFGLNRGYESDIIYKSIEKIVSINGK